VTVSRGDFLRVWGVLLLGRTVGAEWTALADAFAGAPRPSFCVFRIEHASAADFRPHLHTTFTVHSTAGTRLPLTLVQVTQQPTAEGIEQFSLEFHATPGAPALHGTHAIHHGTLGGFDLFIAPVGAASAQRTVYEACFSRHVPASRGARSGADTPGGDADAAD
jgi:hypothetical protein